MIPFLIVRDSGLRASRPVVLIVVIEATATTIALAAAAAARLLLARNSGCSRLPGPGRGLVRCRVDFVHVAVPVVGHTDLAAIDLGQGWRIIVLHQVLVLKIVVRVVVDIGHLRAATTLSCGA